MADIRVVHSFDSTMRETMRVYVNGVEIPDVTEVIHRSYHGEESETELTIRTDKYISVKDIKRISD